MEINELAFLAHAVALDKGWYDPPKSLGEMLLMVHSEVSEGTEEIRDDLDPTEIYYETDKDNRQKPCGFGIEMADIIIRVGDLCANLGIDLEHMIALKMEYNQGRPRRHGGEETMSDENETTAEEANRLIDENDALRGEIAAYREALEEIEWVYFGVENEVRCPACMADKMAGEIHAFRCKTNAALSGQRGQELAVLLEAVGRWRNCRNAWLESSNSDYDRTEELYDASKDELESAYQAVYPRKDKP